MIKLYFVSGASGSGKTAIKSELQRILGATFLIHDFDDIGVPENADKKWRQEATENWLKTLIANGRDACLLGQTVLGEIVSCESAEKLGRINFCFLDVNDFARLVRLRKRNNHHVDQNVLNWASWLRVHCKDPLWQQHVIQENSWDGLNFNKWQQIKDWHDFANIKIIDTSDQNIKETAQSVAKWINNPFESENKIIFLNGPSSSGKTTIAKSLQSKLGTPYMCIGIDKVIAMMSEEMNHWGFKGKSKYGFWWQRSQDEFGNRLAFIQSSSFAKKIPGLLKDIVITMVNAGFNIIIDEVCFEAIDDSFNKWQKILSPYKTIFVGVKCNIKDLEKREEKRKDRAIGSARAQNLTIHQNKTYDIEIDTSNISPSECADKIITFMNNL